VDQQQVVAEFEAHRGRLHALAHRMLGSATEADDALQEAWLRAAAAPEQEIRNPGGWLTTVVARTCLDLLRARKVRPVPDDLSELGAVPAAESASPAQEAELADSVGMAMTVVLQSMNPAERLAFVLHDMFAVSFEEVGAILGRSPAAVRQLASRGRRRVQAPDQVAEDRRRHGEVVSAFLAASRNGDFERLLELLDPEATVVADPAALRMNADAGARGAHEVAATFSGRAKAAVLATAEGFPALAWFYKKVPQVVFSFTIEDDRIVEIELLADPDTIASLDLARVRPRTS
jgi:RNA polymerase sigma factor (sigma-70 family)